MLCLPNDGPQGVCVSLCGVGLSGETLLLVVSVPCSVSQLCCVLLSQATENVLLEPAQGGWRTEGQPLLPNRQRTPSTLPPPPATLPARMSRDPAGEELWGTILEVSDIYLIAFDEFVIGAWLWQRGLQS